MLVFGVWYVYGEGLWWTDYDAGLHVGKETRRGAGSPAKEYTSIYYTSHLALHLYLFSILPIDFISHESTAAAISL